MLDFYVKIADFPEKSAVINGKGYKSFSNHTFNMAVIVPKFTV